MGLIRLFLACVVMIGHLRTSYLVEQKISIDRWLDFAEFGLNSGTAVIYFYIISGFLMSYTITNNYSTDIIGIIGFYRSRFIRIFSLYWPLMIIASMIALPLSLSPRAVLTGTFLFGSDWYVALASYPDLNFSNFPVFINQAWTLGAEITFYAFAPLLVRSLPASICVLLLSAACRLSFVRVYGFDNTWTYTFFPSTVMFFVIGHFARLIGDRLPTHKLLGVGLFAASMLVSAHGISYQKWDNLNFYISILLFALSLPGIFALTKRSGWMNSVGNLSYPMYLTHKMTLFGIYGLFPFIGTAIARSDKLFVPGFVSVLSVLAICIAISVVAHIVIEQPVAKSMWRLLRRRPHIAATAPAQARANPEKYSPPPNSRVKHEIR